jgi:two-component system LytT family response regulator
MSQKIKSIIVEDESTARDVLLSYLGKYCPQISVIGTAQNIKEAVPLIAHEQPQLVFLDVEMPFGNAFDVLEACKGYSFKTIFVTAYSEYSLKALNMSAAYYLLKPLSIEELIVAVNKVQEEIAIQADFDRNKIIIENFKENKPEKQQIILPTMEGFEVVRIENIVRLKGNGNFTDVYLNDGSKKMVCRFLKHFTEILPFPFMRVHKTHIINLQFIKSYHKGTGGFVKLLDNTEIEIYHSYKDLFLQHFK